MTKREYALAIAVIISVTLCIWTFLFQRLVTASSIRDGALSQWRSVVQKLEERDALRRDIGLGALHRRDQEDVMKRVREQLQDLGIRSSVIRGVRPREERAIQDGAAIRQTVMIELQSLKPAEIGAWLYAWSQHENPWKITGMTWRHHGRGDDAGNTFDLTMSCAAVLVQ